MIRKSTIYGTNFFFPYYSFLLYLNASFTKLFQMYKSMSILKIVSSLFDLYTAIYGTWIHYNSIQA